MSTSQVMTNRITHIALITFLMLISVSTHAQFVAIRLEVPAGIHFNAQVLEPREGGTWENSKAKIWVGIESQENLSFLLDIDFPDAEILPSPEAYFLNDTTDDFEKAMKLGSEPQELKMRDHPNLIRKMIPRPTHIQAWLGLPLLNGTTIKIEYP